MLRLKKGLMIGLFIAGSSLFLSGLAQAVEISYYASGFHA
jgi:hypothetical protein